MRVTWLGQRDLEHPRAGGAERSIHEITTRLADRGHQIEIVTGGWPGAPRVVRRGNLTVRRYPGWFSPRIVAPVRALLRTDPSDIIIDDLAHAIPWCTPFVSKKRGIAFFHHLHARTLSGQIRRPFSDFLIELERSYPRIYRDWFFVTESSSSLADLVRIGVPRASVRIIPPGVDSTVFSSGERTGYPQVVYFGGTRDYKRPWDAIYAFAVVSKSISNARLVLVGEGPGGGRLHELARQLGIIEKIEWYDKVNQTTLAELVARSWANVHTSQAEGWCFSALEAASCGVPTVGYDIPGLRDCVINGSTGLLVPEASGPGAIGKALEVMLSDPDDWWKRSHLHGIRFTWERTASSWEALLREVLEG